VLSILYNIIILEAFTTFYYDYIEVIRREIKYIVINTKDLTLALVDY